MGGLGAGLPSVMIRFKVRDFFDFRERSFRFQAKVNCCFPSLVHAAVADRRPSKTGRIQTSLRGRKAAYLA
jgi:hypothetical protein